MSVSRRDFLKLTGGSLALGAAGVTLSPEEAAAQELRTKGAKQTTTICPYCAVGCSILIHAKDGKVINVEGDHESPINEGALCPKGASLFQMANNETRLRKPQYRAPGATEWKEVEWGWALDQIARRVKDSRDKTFKKTAKQKIKVTKPDGTVVEEMKELVVNRCDGIAHVGSAALDNEELYILQKLVRSWGLAWIEHQARLCHSSTVPALAESFGRGAMTNHWVDLRNADVILVMGSNPASNHPLAMKWIMKARETRGAKLVVVDPRFSQTAAKADLYASLRSGTDIAFLGGMIKYIIDNNLIFRDYVVNYTNAAYLVNPDFKMPIDLDGVFSGYDEKTRTYDKKTWSFQLDANGVPKKDPTLKNPNCVFQLLKKHYSRYTLDKVEAITGTPKDKLVEVYKIVGSTGKPNRVGTECYAMGWTQHSVGVQNIRTMAIIQLLLGNIGMAGGGIAAMRGESNVQASTDYGLLFHILPGYNATPTASLVDLKAYNDKYTPKTKEPKSVNWWANRPKYMASYLKSLYGANATKENDFGYAWLPKIDEGANYSWLNLFDAMFKGQFEGFFAWGMNPACSGANSNKTRKALTKLKWMVNVNLYDNETGSFWKGPGMNSKDIQTEVFMLPCASSIEKEGSITNSGRVAQWRYKAIEPIGNSLPDGELVNELYHRVRKLYQKEGGAYPAPIVNLYWPHGTEGRDGKFGHLDMRRIAQEINGYYLRDVYDKTGKLIGKKGDLVGNFTMLQDDGSTSCGCWLYSGSFTQKDGKIINNMMKRGKDDPTGIGLFPNWAWAWPLNRRILYNRASVNPQGQPWDPKRAVIKWNGSKWEGDVPDGPAAPMAAEGGKLPFIMQANGVGSLFGPGLVDGPFPEHYEPLECPLQESPLNKKHRVNPAIKLFFGKEGDLKEDTFASCDTKYPIVCSSYRNTEHWQTGLMTRHCSWLLEAQPQMWVEMSQELAKERGIKNGDKVNVTSARGTTWAVAIVTERFKPFKIMNQTVHQIGIPWHFGWQYPTDGSGGDSANLLTPTVGDANTMIPESKAFMVNIEKARG